MNLLHTHTHTRIQWKSMKLRESEIYWNYNWQYAKWTSIRRTLSIEWLVYVGIYRWLLVISSLWYVGKQFKHIRFALSHSLHSLHRMDKLGKIPSEINSSIIASIWFFLFVIFLLCVFILVNVSSMLSKLIFFSLIFISFTLRLCIFIYSRQYRMNVMDERAGNHWVHCGIVSNFTNLFNSHLNFDGVFFFFFFFFSLPSSSIGWVDCCYWCCFFCSTWSLFI